MLVADAVSEAHKSAYYRLFSVGCKPGEITRRADP